MLDFIIVVGAIFGLAFFIKESDGPWGLMARARNELFKNPHVGTFFYKLLDCYFCLGFHCGWFVYLLHEKIWSLNLLICWGLAGGMISLIMDLILTRLTAPLASEPEPPLEAPQPRKRTKVKNG
jgi:hypothetical protein